MHIGIDVGGTNTDAVLMDGAETLAGVKNSTTPDVTSGIVEAIAQLRERHPKLGLLAAGGVNGQNAADYAASGVDALVTSSLHYAPPADVGVQMEPQ